MQRARAILVAGLVALVLTVSGVAVASASHLSYGTGDPHDTGPGYTVTFSETGLPGGTNWSVRVAGVWGGWIGHRGETNSSVGSAITFSLPNGTYRYFADSPPGFATSDGRGSFNVTGGSPPAIGISYTTLTTYSVTFHESGLAPGTDWTVTVHGHGRRSVRSESSETPTITFQLTNGPYRYQIGREAGYAATPARGDVVVAGSAPNATNVTFTPLAYYEATFSESGLPTGTNWSVAIVGFAWGVGFVAQHATTTGTTIAFNLTNGSYLYFIGPVPGWQVTGSEPFGAISVDGASPPAVSVTFGPVATHPH